MAVASPKAAWCWDVGVGQVGAVEQLYSRLGEPFGVGRDARAVRSVSRVLTTCTPRRPRGSGMTGHAADMRADARWSTAPPAIRPAPRRS